MFKVKKVKNKLTTVLKSYSISRQECSDFGLRESRLESSKPSPILHEKHMADGPSPSIKCTCSHCVTVILTPLRETFNRCLAVATN